MAFTQTLERAVNRYKTKGLYSLVEGAYHEITHPRKQVMPLPVSAQIEITTLCNFKCITCSRLSLPSNRLAVSLTPEKFKEILDKIPTLKFIKLQGLGEPLMTPRLQEILDIAKQRNVKLYTISNGSMFHSEKYINLALQFDRVSISFDSTDPAMFEQIRVGGNFHKIIENIKKLTDERDRQGKKLKVSIGMVATHLNYMQIPQLHDIAMKTGVDEIGVIEVENWYVPKEKEYQESVSFVQESRKKKEEMLDNVEKLRRSLKPKGVEVGFTSSHKRKDSCLWTFDSIFITADGYLTSCCIRMNPDVHNFGNIFSLNDFNELWNNQKYQDFRAAMMNGTSNGICDSCPD